MEYIRLAEGLNKYILIPANENIWSRIKSNEKDYYTSIFKYNQNQFETWKATKSVAGIKDVTTNKLVFDFDSVNNVEEARQDAITLATRFITKGIPSENIQVAFSGNKGFSVEVDTTERFTPEEFKRTTFVLAKDLKTFDSVVNDPNRLMRVVGTKHNKSGLYKFPLNVNQLSELNVEEIRELAVSLDNIDDTVFDGWTEVSLPDIIKQYKIPEKKAVKPIIVNDLDITQKPKWLSPVRYALQEGFFGSGERNHAFMILCITYKKQGFSKEIVYRMLKGVAEKQAQRNDVDKYANEELWSNIINVVYSNNWQGGVYKDSEDPLLKAIAERLNLKIKDEVSDYEPAYIHSIHDKFKNYVQNIDKNTILTGIKSLDEKVFISIGANVGIVGAPGSGKSSLALNILNNTSKAGIKTVFASFDMARTRMYEKILYKITGLGRKQLYDIFKNNPVKEKELHDKVKEEFGNVYFYDKSAATVDDIKEYIERCNDLAVRPEDKVKLVMIDYFEMVDSNGVSDETASSKRVAQQLQGIVNTLDVAQIVLLQPNKMTGDMREPITSYTSIKGSSFLAQSFRIAMGIYREGFDPNHPDDDRFLSINILKNDLGETGSLDFNWIGKRGEITEMHELEQQELEALRKELSSRKKEKNSDF